MRPRRILNSRTSHEGLPVGVASVLLRYLFMTPMVGSLQKLPVRQDYTRDCERASLRLISSALLGAYYLSLLRQELGML